VRLRVLGPVELLGSEGEPLPLGGRRQEALLAILCTEANRVVPASRLIELVWPEDGPRDPVAALHNQVWRLRRTIARAGLRLERRPPGYLLAVARSDVDALAFERLVSGTPTEEPDPAALPELLATGLALWRGEPYAGLHDIPVLRHESGRLTEVRLSWLERVTDRLLDAGDTTTASAYLHRAVAEAPLRERPRVLLMRALAAEGRTSEATAQYHAYRTLHTAETGLDPGPGIETAYRRLLRGELDALPSGPVAPPRTRPLTLTPVPAPVSPIVGRQRDLDQLRDLIRRGHRLVSLTGLGGVGKTRLAVELAHRGWDGEAGFVDLTGVDAPEDLPEAFARAHGVSLTGHDPAADLAAGIGERELLLVVDGVEPMLPAADFLVSLLSRCPGVRAVVTSRERLAVPGGTEYPVRPLAVPAADADADEILDTASVTLFLERLPDLVVPGGAEDGDRAVATRVGRLCRELGGLPLAIELAAALTRHRSIDEVFDHLVRSLADPSPDGAAGPLESAIRWSYERLHPTQQRVLRRLCVFRGQFDVEAARAVCPGEDAGLVAALDRLGALGLLTVHRGRSGVRYSLPRIPAGYLERYRQDPVERADAEAAHFHHHAGQCRNPRYLDDRLVARIDAGYPDFLAALDRGIAGPDRGIAGPDRGIAGPDRDEEVHDLAVAVALYWLWRDRPRLALRWLDRVAARFADAPPRLARTDVQRAVFLRNLGRTDEAAELAARSTTTLAAVGDLEWLLTGYSVLAAVADDRGKADETVRCAQAAVRTARAGVPRRLAEALGYLAYAHVVAGEPERAAEVALEALALLDDVDSPTLRAGTRVNAAQALTEAGHGTVALEVLTSGLPELRSTTAGIPAYQLNLGWAQLATGDHAGALRWFRTFLDQVGPTGQWRWVTEAVAGCACALLACGRTREAALALGGAERLMERLNLRVSRWIRHRLDEVYAAVARRPSGRDLVHAGAQLTADAVIQLVSGGRTGGEGTADRG
jgi:DNA-binding SARP family transcriptional activator/tetratricopeptide (TPR) repeat protein